VVSSITATPSGTVQAVTTGRVPRTHVDHGANVAHFFSSYPWLAWPLVGLGVLVFLALLPLRIFGSAPWYVKLGIIATLGTGAFVWWRRRKQNQAANQGQWNQGQWTGGQPPGYYPPPPPASFEPQDDPNWKGHVR
jgi:hypothetical protein